MRKLTLPFVLATALCGGAASAQPGGDDRPPPPGLPEEAFTACKDLNEGDACTAKMHDHERKGQCVMGRETRLWCRPSGPPPPRPPQ